MDSAIGTVTITEVEESSSVGRFNGTGAVQVGDSVRSAQ